MLTKSITHANKKSYPYQGKIRGHMLTKSISISVKISGDTCLQNHIHIRVYQGNIPIPKSLQNTTGMRLHEYDIFMCKIYISQKILLPLLVYQQKKLFYKPSLRKFNESLCFLKLSTSVVISFISDETSACATTFRTLLIKAYKKKHTWENLKVRNKNRLVKDSSSQT
jgi:hypothetical protein